MNEYKTTDMDFATLLYCLKKKIKRLETISAKQKMFIFEDDGSIEKLKMDYINSELTVEPKALWESMRSIKSMLYSI